MIFPRYGNLCRRNFQQKMYFNRRDTYLILLWNKCRIISYCASNTIILLPSIRRVLSQFFSVKKRFILLTCNRGYALRAREFPNKNLFRYYSLLCKKGDARGPRFMSPSFLFLCRRYNTDRPFHELIRLTSV